MSRVLTHVQPAAGVAPSTAPGGAGFVDPQAWLIALLVLVAVVGLTWWLRRK